MHSKYLILFDMRKIGVPKRETDHFDVFLFFNVALILPVEVHPELGVPGLTVKYF